MCVQVPIVDIIQQCGVTKQIEVLNEVIRPWLKGQPVDY